MDNALLLSALGRPLAPYIGIDFNAENCWQIFRRMYLELFSIELPTLEGQYHCPTQHKENSGLISQESTNWLPVAAGEERFGDAVLLHIYEMPAHIGFVTHGFVAKPRHMIHSQDKTFSVHESYIHSQQWKDRKKSFYRHPLLA